MRTTRGEGVRTRPVVKNWGRWKIRNKDAGKKKKEKAVGVRCRRSDVEEKFKTGDIGTYH